MDYPLVSIIIPCYNSEKYIAEAIESALNQTYPNIEVVVIDDGSTDDSLNIINKYSNKIIFKSQKNSGAPAARNYGLTFVNSEYINFLDADDLLLPEAVMSRYMAIGNNDAVYGDEIYFSGSIDNVIKRRKTFPPYKHNLLASFLHPEGHPATNAVLIKRSCFKKIKWREDLKSGQEFMLWLDLAKTNLKFKHINQDVTLIRLHDSESRISNQGIKKIYNNQLKLFKIIKFEFNTVIESNKEFESELNWHFLTSSINTLRYFDFDLSNKFYENVNKSLIIKHPNFKWFSSYSFTYLTNQYIGFYSYQFFYQPLKKLKLLK
jgi:glycosyltransferase involved in cell wall biosynthesis